MSRAFKVGQFVMLPGSSEIGKVGDIQADALRVDFFESIAEPIADSQWISPHQCQRVSLSPEMRVYRRDPSTGTWLVGRVQASEADICYVQFPNFEYHFPVPEEELHVRRHGLVNDPVQVLGAGGNESGYFHDARLPILHGLILQRAASGNTPALLSSAVEVYPHQVQAALTVLSDPVQRYLLADEVGLGKTIEAGYVIRQTLIDDPFARVAVLAPASVVGQWRRELLEKFFIDDFPRGTVTVDSHATPEAWAVHQDCSLLVVDEAHLLVQDISAPAESPYRELCDVAHSARRLLLLSATPPTAHHATHLGMLHLLDRDLYRWEERETFERRHAMRRSLADSAFQLDSYFPALLASTVDDLRGLLPHDPRFEELAARVLALLDEDGDLTHEDFASELAVRVEDLRAHISETYRLHRRVIRHRRASVLLEDEESELLPYEVHGRSRPALLALDSAGHHSAHALLLAWRSLVADHAIDSRLSEDQRIAYGKILAVLSSRANGPADDLRHALRWRVYQDRAAADRGGLTPQERQMLAVPDLVAGESLLVGEFEDQVGRLTPSAEQKALVDAVQPVLARGGRILIFCGPGSLAGDLASALRQQHPELSVGEHTSAADPENTARAVQAWRAPSDGPTIRVLVADDSAEEGLNLQVADVVVHVRLPWSPNRLEQRLGRVDRYRGAESARQHRPARQYRVGDNEGEETFSGAWAVLLREGYSIFDGSVSTVQEAIAEGLDNTWLTGLEDGPTGLIGVSGAVREDLRQARRDIDAMDMLESVHETSIQAHQITTSLNEIEVDWRTIQAQVLHYAGDSNGGLKFVHRTRTVSGIKRDEFDLSASRPLIDPRHYAVARSRVRPGMAQGVFNRSTALRAPGTRLYRLGNPFIDMLADVVFADERGQATAFRRFDQGYRGEDTAYFGFEFLVEADIATALARVADLPAAKRALRRQADRLLPPFTRKVWVQAGHGQALSHKPACDWLNAEYSKPRDQNYNFRNNSELVAGFGGWDEYRASAEAAERVARLHLVESSDLTGLCVAAQQQARQQLSVAKIQAQARQAAGRLLGDTESYLMDVAVTDGLIELLTRPTILTVAAMCVVRGGVRRVQRDA